jgi:hypothetical protein
VPAVSVAPVVPVASAVLAELEEWVVSAASVARATVRRNCLRAAIAGSTTHSIVVAPRIAIERRRIDLGAQLAEIHSLTGRLAPGSRLADRAEVYRVLGAEALESVTMRAAWVRVIAAVAQARVTGLQELAEAERIVSGAGMSHAGGVAVDVTPSEEVPEGSVDQAPAPTAAVVLPVWEAAAVVVAADAAAVAVVVAAVGDGEKDAEQKPQEHCNEIKIC